MTHPPNTQSIYIELIAHLRSVSQKAPTRCLPQNVRCRPPPLRQAYTKVPMFYHFETLLLQPLLLPIWLNRLFLNHIRLLLPEHFLIEQCYSMLAVNEVG